MEELILTVVVRAFAAGTPLLLGTIGEIVTERSGVLNLGVEGMMAIGAVTGYLGALYTGSPWMGLMFAAMAGATISQIHALVSVTLKANQVVSGLALTMLGIGLAGLLGKPYIGRPLATKMNPVHLPMLSDIPILGRVLFSHDPFFYLAIALGVLFWFLLQKTRWGIKVRSVGENPAASEAQGVSVAAVRYTCVGIGGAMAGLAGAHLSLAYSKSWIEGMTGGRGWIVIALTIFALWNPLRAFVGAFVFGGIFVLQYLLQPLGVPPNVLSSLPYVATLSVLLIGGMSRDRRRFSAPAMLGEPYSRGER